MRTEYEAEGNRNQRSMTTTRDLEAQQAAGLADLQAVLADEQSAHEGVANDVQAPAQWNNQLVAEVEHSRRSEQNAETTVAALGERLATPGVHFDDKEGRIIDPDQ